MMAEDMMRNSVIIAAHPDDELLWFGAILKQVDQVIMVYHDYWPNPDVGEARTAVLEDYPRDGVTSLNIPEAATHSCADWTNPRLTEYGIELGFEATLRDLKQHAKKLVGRSLAPAGGISANYEENYHRLYDDLKSRLTPEMNVFTHNPWGEYGHEDHIQVYRVVERLRREIGYRQWMTNYCTERSLPLAMRYFSNDEVEHIQLPVDAEFSDRVADCFRKNGCWTWADNWKWFPFELYLQAPDHQVEVDGQPHIVPLNMFRLGQ